MWSGLIWLRTETRGNGMESFQTTGLFAVLKCALWREDSSKLKLMEFVREIPLVVTSLVLPDKRMLGGRSN